MKRALLGLGLAAMFAAAPIAGGTAAAAPPTKATILLTCDKNVDAQVTLTLEDTVGGNVLATVTPTDLSCGPTVGSNRARVVVPTDGTAGAALVTQFATASGGNNRDCSAPDGALPVTIICTLSGNATAQLTVTAK
jgi:hypothetical protein